MIGRIQNYNNIPTLSNNTVRNSIKKPVVDYTAFNSRTSYDVPKETPDKTAKIGAIQWFLAMMAGEGLSEDSRSRVSYLA